MILLTTIMYIHPVSFVNLKTEEDHHYHAITSYNMKERQKYLFENSTPANMAKGPLCLNKKMLFFISYTPLLFQLFFHTPTVNTMATGSSIIGGDKKQM